MYRSFFNPITCIFIVILLSIFTTYLVSPPQLQLETQSEFIWPIPNNKNITSYFGKRISPTSGASNFHYGIDIAAPEGTPIHSCSSGKVIFIGFNRC